MPLNISLQLDFQTAYNFTWSPPALSIKFACHFYWPQKKDVCSFHRRCQTGFSNDNTTTNITSIWMLKQCTVTHPHIDNWQSAARAINNLLKRRQVQKGKRVWPWIETFLFSFSSLAAIDERFVRCRSAYIYMCATKLTLSHFYSPLCAMLLVASKQGSHTHNTCSASFQRQTSSG